MTDDKTLYKEFQDDAKPPLVLDRSLVRKYAFYHDDPPFDVLFVVSNNYEEEHWFLRLLRNPKVRYFAIKEPYPDLEVATKLVKALVETPEDQRIAIACTAGVNRSASTAAILHAHRTGKSFCEALRDVKRYRNQAAPFWHMASALCLAYEGFTGRSLGPAYECCGRPDDYENETNFMFTSEDFNDPDKRPHTLKKWEAIAKEQSKKCEGC